MCVCRGPKSVGGITWAKRAHAQSQYWATSDTRIIHFDYALEISFSMTEKKRSFRKRNLKQTELHRLKNRGKKG